MKPKDLPLFQNKEAKRVLAEACRTHKVSIDLLQELLEVQRKYAGSGRAKGITSDFNTAIKGFIEDHGDGSEA